MHPGSEATTSNTFALSCWTTRVQRRQGFRRTVEAEAAVKAIEAAKKFTK
jgi:hypothetical protein